MTRTTARATRPEGRGWVWLTAGCLAAAVAWQVWLIGAHWIDPDEGAHLMDARLAAEGLTPGVDFKARQPLYVYTYLPAFHLFGDHYRSGRVMPLLWTLLTGVVVWALGRRLWGHREAHAALLLFAFAPSIVINSSVVKTEPLAMLLMALGMLGLAVHLQSRRWWPLVLAGAAFGVGYYVRESTLAGPLAATAVFLSQMRHDGWRTCARRLATLGAGYALVVAAVLAAYASRIPLDALLTSSTLFPLARVAKSLGHIAGWLVPQAAETAGRVRHSDQNWSATLDHLTDAARLNLHLVAGTLVALALWVRDVRRKAAARRRDRAEEGTAGLVIAGAWLASLTLLYGYHVLHRGFFQSYVRELIPPMALLSGWALVRLLRELGWERRAGALAPLTLLACAAVAALGLRTPGSAMFVALLAIAGTGWAVFRPSLTVPAHRRAYAAAWLALVCAYAAAVAIRPLLQLIFPAAAVGMVLLLATGRGLGDRAAARFLACAVLAGSTALTAAYAGRLLSPAYDCDWSPQTVAAASEAIAASSDPDDEVLSGGMVWTLESGRRPFLNMTHPLAYTHAMPPDMVRRVAERLATTPPRVIVLDHYAEWTYARQVPEFAPVLARSYRLIWEHRDARRPVRVYVLTSRPAAARPGR